MFGCHTDGPGLEYPKGSGRYCMYAAGLWIAARVNGEIRAALGAYIPEYKPGCIYPDGSYDQDSEPRHRVYKLVRGDTLSSDYTDWPAVLGAPVDAEGRPPGHRRANPEAPLSQCANPAGHLAPEGGTAPLGIEVQQTAYGFGWPVAFGNVLFLEFQGHQQAANTLEDAYFGGIRERGPGERHRRPGGLRPGPRPRLRLQWQQLRRGLRRSSAGPGRQVGRPRGPAACPAG